MFTALATHLCSAANRLGSTALEEELDLTHLGNVQTNGMKQFHLALKIAQVHVQYYSLQMFILSSDINLQSYSVNLLSDEQ